ncbi:MAG TPA: transglutaminase family protein [Verrucomicrobiales bacterium]|jgi:transglutaminase-like putative cysteine protease|nr:transglutaminase family protein [Verrucomicrobiales bacterium]
MLYQISHRTLYTYDSPVTVAHCIARLEPRQLITQDCPWHEIHIHPQPASRSAGRTDVFGNTAVYFEIEGTHAELEVVARSYVRLSNAPLPGAAATPPWESVRDLCRSDRWDAGAAAGEFIWASPLIPLHGTFAEYARPSFPEGRPVLAGVCDLNSRIHREFQFDPEATSVATPVMESFNNKRGVCQDFAQVMIACLRSIGLPARYVSGYLETVPPPGMEKLTGADASHAWVSVWCGEEHGWIDADPTNDLLPSGRHITLCWGRDFSDVSPLTGVSLGSGSQNLTVSVDVMAMEE